MAYSVSPMAYRGTGDLRGGISDLRYAIRHTRSAILDRPVEPDGRIVEREALFVRVFGVVHFGHVIEQHHGFVAEDLIAVRDSGGDEDDDGIGLARVHDLREAFGGREQS